MSRYLQIDDDADVHERLYELGFTDGLPVVPPTPARVAAMLAAGRLDGDDVIGSVPERNRVVYAEDVAVNSVMAGCHPRFFPIVLAGVEALLDPVYNAHTALTSTGGAGICVVVSGPLGAEVGMNPGHSALGPGNRANATIGRAVRLVAFNVLGARPDQLDASSVSHPGKYTMCFLEATPSAPWEPLRVTLGYDVVDTTVSIMATEGPRTVANHLNGDGLAILDTFAAALSNPSTFIVGKGGQAVVLLGPEHQLALIESGIARREAQEMLLAATRVGVDTLERAGVLLETGASQHPQHPDEHGKLPSFVDAEDIVLVTAGGEGAGWSACMPSWAPRIHSRMTTRRVRPAGEAPPDCGDEACEVSLPAIRRGVV
jgi:hypothetical protein